jgi:FkbM family methyltransferase
MLWNSKKVFPIIWIVEKFGIIFSLQKQRKAKIFYSPFATIGGLYFDIGANKGKTLKFFLNNGMKVVAVEPQIECVKYLKFRFGNKIYVINKGVGKDSIPKTMYISNHNVLSSFSTEWISKLVEGQYFSKKLWEHEREIEMTTLDVLIDDYGLPDFIKIDVEGYELEVLKGLSRDVNIISFEYTVPELIDKVILCINRLIEVYNGNFVCNYSPEGHLKLILKKWVTPEYMKETIITQNDFLSTRLGDIYIKKASVK